MPFGVCEECPSEYIAPSKPEVPHVQGIDYYGSTLAFRKNPSTLINFDKRWFSSKYRTNISRLGPREQWPRIMLPPSYNRVGAAQHREYAPLRCNEN